MMTNGSGLAADHSKGGGGVERGGDPCGRPGGLQCAGERASWPGWSEVGIFAVALEDEMCRGERALAGVERDRDPCGRPGG